MSPEKEKYQKMKSENVRTMITFINLIIQKAVTLNTKPLTYDCSESELYTAYFNVQHLVEETKRDIENAARIEHVYRTLDVYENIIFTDKE